LFVNSDKHIIPILENVARLDSGVKFHTPNGLHARFIDKKIGEPLDGKPVLTTSGSALRPPTPKLLKQQGQKVKPADVEICR
jgi:hypothetical protein